MLGIPRGKLKIITKLTYFKTNHLKLAGWVSQNFRTAVKGHGQKVKYPEAWREIHTYIGKFDPDWVFEPKDIPTYMKAMEIAEAQSLPSD